MLLFSTEEKYKGDAGGRKHGRQDERRGSPPQKSPPRLSTPVPTSKDEAMQMLPELFTPRKHSQVRYAHYFGLEGYAAASDATQILFRTAESLWTPVVNPAELVILGLVADAEVQLVLDHCAGGYAAVCTSRANLEV